MKQPAALLPLSLTEMWERFGLYMVQGLLIFYMTKALNFTDLKAYAVMGQFTALVYISPIVGGLCADRLLGFRQTILLGAYLLLIGYALLSLSSIIAHELGFNNLLVKEVCMFLGLAIIILGNGFLKPNISSFLGQFYHDADPRRDAGFTLYYMIFNLGIILSTLSSGYIQRWFGWSATFGVAAFGLVLAIGFFRWGYQYFGNEGWPSKPLQPLRPITQWFSKRIHFAITIVVGAAVCYELLRLEGIGNLLLAIVGVVILLVLALVTFRLEKLDRQKMLTLLILIVISVVFWAVFFQIFLVDNLFIDRNVDRQIFGQSVPAMAFISLESVFIFALSPLFAWLWRKLHERKMLVSRGLQFALALLTIAIALEFIVIGIHFPNAQGLVNPLWIVISYLMITVGELMLSPIGLSMVTQLAPQKFVGVMMGVWFLGLSYGGLLAGILGKQASVPAALIGQPVLTNPIYGHAFQNYALLAFAAALLTLILTPWLNRLTR